MRRLLCMRCRRAKRPGDLVQPVGEDLDLVRCTDCGHQWKSKHPLRDQLIIFADLPWAASTP